MPEVVGEGEIVLTPNNAAVLAAFEQTQKAGEQTTTYLEKLYAREEAWKVIRAERAAEKAAKAKEREAAREIRAGEKAAAAAEKQRAKEVAAAEKAADREAKAAEKARARETAAAEKAAKRQQRLREEAAAKAAALSTFGGRAKALQQNQLISELETVASMFTQIGGAASQAGILVSSAIRPVALFATAAGGVALGLAAIPAAAGVAAYAIKAVADAGVEARDRLDEMGRGALVSREAREALGDYETATRELSVALDELTVQFGTRAAPAATKFATALRLLTGGKPELEQMLRESSNDGRMLADVLDYLAEKAGRAGRGLQELSAIAVTGGGFLLVDEFNAAVDAYINGEADKVEAAEATRRAQTAATEQAIREASEEEQRRSESAGRAASAIAEARRKEATAAAEAARKAEEAEREAARRRMEIERESAAESARRRQEALDQIERETIALEDQRQAVLRLAAATRALTGLYDDQQEALADLGVMVEATVTKMQDATEEYAGSWEQAGDAIEEALGRPEVQAAIEGLNQMLTATQDILGLISEAQTEAASAWKDRLDKTIENERRVNGELKRLRADLAATDDKNHKKALQNQIAELEGDQDVIERRKQRRQEEFDQHARLARRAFVGEQAGAIGQALMNTGLAVTLALATIPPPFGYIAAGGAAAAGAAQVAGIASRKPPEFPMGMSAPGASPDHPILAAIQPNERIVNSRGARDDDEIRRRNEGRYREPEMTAHVYLGNKLIAAARGRERVRVDPRAGKATRRRGR